MVVCCFMFMRYENTRATQNDKRLRAQKGSSDSTLRKPKRGAGASVTVT
jgi:hypothetical protein